MEEEHAETAKELSRIQELLTSQYNVNEVSTKEIVTLTEKLKQQEKEFETKLQEYLHLLDLRNARIQVSTFK